MDADELATKITDKLFTNGAGDHAERLVLELKGGLNGGGWSNNAMRDFILDILVAHHVTFPPNTKHHSTERTEQDVTISNVSYLVEIRDALSVVISEYEKAIKAQSRGS